MPLKPLLTPDIENEDAKQVQNALSMYIFKNPKQLRNITLAQFCSKHIYTHNCTQTENELTWLNVNTAKKEKKVGGGNTYCEDIQECFVHTLTIHNIHLCNVHCHIHRTSHNIVH